MDQKINSSDWLVRAFVNPLVFVSGLFKNTPINMIFIIKYGKGSVKTSNFQMKVLTKKPAARLTNKTLNET
ncbi:hypothetical protein CHH82_15835 [Bacillus velezensis]|nr:hypothetical protein CHH82_15835 [Bacillus velezensis]